MTDLIKIKCPGCGSILQLKNTTDIENKPVTCPVCKLKSRIGDCEKLIDKNDDDATQYSFKNKNSDEDTQLRPNQVSSTGVLINTQTGSRHYLKLGRNSIGREVISPLPSVTIPIKETQTHNTMSREHAIIEITRLGNGSYRHFLYNWKGKNGTFVDGTPLNDGERVILVHGQMIKLGQVLLRFELE